MAAVLSPLRGQLAEGGSRFTLLPPVDLFSENSDLRWITGVLKLPAPTTYWRVERSLSLTTDGSNDFRNGWFTYADGQACNVFTSSLFPGPTFPNNLCFQDPETKFHLPLQCFSQRQLAAAAVADPNTIGLSLFVDIEENGTSQVVGWWRQPGTSWGPSSAFGINFLPSQFDLRAVEGQAHLLRPVRFMAGANIKPLNLNGKTLQLNMDALLLSSTPGPEFGDTNTRNLVRGWILEAKTQLEQNFNEPYPPPSGNPIPRKPVSLDERSYFRMRCYAVPPISEQAPEALRNAFSDLIISEACFYNTNGLSYTRIGSSTPEYPDWIEIYNPTDQEIELSGYAFSDKATKLGLYLLPGTGLGPNSSFIYYCSGRDPAEVAALLPRHIPFMLKDEGEDLYLSKIVPGGYAPVYTLHASAHRAPTHPVPNISFGVCVENGVVFEKYFHTQTVAVGSENQGAPNPPLGSSFITAEPRILNATVLPNTEQALSGGIFEAADCLQIALLPAAGALAGASVVYTTDGSEPNASSTIYTAPITVTHTTVLRCRAYQPDSIPSAAVTRSFIYKQDVLAQQEIALKPQGNGEADSGLVVLGAHFAVGDPGETETPQGIAAELTRIPSVSIVSKESFVTNPSFPFPEGQDFVVSFEWIDPQLPNAYCQENASLHRAGGLSIGSAKGSYEITFKKSLSLTGAGKWVGPVLPNGNSALFPNSTVTKFNELRLRNSSSWQIEYGGTYFADSFLKETHRAMGGLTPERRWVHLYINGLYMGITDFEEHFDEVFVADHTGLHAPNIRILNYGGGAPITPQGEEAKVKWTELVTAATAAANDPNSTVLWDAFAAKIDLDDYIGYLVTLCLVRPADFGHAQWRGWYDSSGDKRFHFLAWDGDGVTLSGVPEISFITSPFVEDGLLPTEPSRLLMHCGVGKSLLAHPKYAEIFKTRLNQLLVTGLAGGKSAERVDANINAVRRIIHAEAWRWANNSDLADWRDVAYPANQPLGIHSYLEQEVGFLFDLSQIGLTNLN